MGYNSWEKKRLEEINSKTGIQMQFTTWKYNVKQVKGLVPGGLAFAFTR